MSELGDGLEFFFDRVDSSIVPRKCASDLLQLDVVDQSELMAMHKAVVEDRTSLLAIMEPAAGPREFAGQLLQSHVAFEPEVMASQKVGCGDSRSLIAAMEPADGVQGRCVSAGDSAMIHDGPPGITSSRSTGVGCKRPRGSAYDSDDVPGEGEEVESEARPHPARRTDGWTRRVRIGREAQERDKNPDRKSALEASIRDYADHKSGLVVNPSVGTTFDTVQEAYDFYNLYSWETGFGIRYAKSRLNVHRVKCMQEIVCGCAGKPLRENTRSTETEPLWSRLRHLPVVGA